MEENAWESVVSFDIVSTLCHLYLSQSFMKISTTSIVIVVYSCNCIYKQKGIRESKRSTSSHAQRRPSSDAQSKK